MRKDLTTDEMKDYIEHLERRIFYMQMLLDSLREDVDDIENIALDLSKWVNMDNETYVKEYTTMYPDSSADFTDVRSAYAGKTGHAIASSSSILIRINSYRNAYKDIERDEEFLKNYCKKYEINDPKGGNV